MKKRNIFYYLFAFVLLTGLLSSCSAASAPVQESPTGGASVVGVTLDESTSGENLPLNIHLEQELNAVQVNFSGKITSGVLRLVLLDEEQEAVLDLSVGEGDFSIQNPLYDLPAGEYRLGIEWYGPVSGNYDMEWQHLSAHTGEVSVLVLIPGTGMTLVALGFLFYMAKKKLGWKYAGLGALAWVVTVALKFAWALPVNTVVYNALMQTLPENVAFPLVCLYIGALTGVFEVGLTFLFLKFTRFGKAGWKQALAFGIGFGAVEALLLGMVSLGTVVPALLNPGVYPAQAMATILKMNNLLYDIAPILERFFTVWIHMFCNLLIFYAILCKQNRWFWLSFVFKTLIDTAAAYGQLTGIETLQQLWLLEGIVAVWGVLAWVGVRRLHERYVSFVGITPAAQTMNDEQGAN